MTLTRESSIAGVPVITVVGEIDLNSSSKLREELGRQFDDAGPFAVLDLSEVVFIDSSGLKALDDSREHAATTGTAIALACSQDRIVRLLRITGLDTRFATVAPTAQDAARSGPSVG